MKHLILILITVVFLSSCKIQKESASSQQSISSIEMALHDIWVLEEISNRKIEDLGSFSKRPQLEIFVKEMRVVGNDGCNRFSGPIQEINDIDIVFGPLIASQMACKEMKISDEFNRTLAKTSSYKRAGFKLLLFDNTGHEILRFQKID